MAAITVDETKGECLVYSFKEGLLSAAAHDLRMRVGRWKLGVSEDRRSIKLQLDATSLRVVCVMRDGRPDTSAPSERDRKTIDGHILDDVLEARRFPVIDLDATIDDNKQLKGNLTLHGVTRPITTQITERDGSYHASVEVNQVDYRIKPFSAMLGTLKVKPIVRIELRVPTTLA